MATYRLKRKNFAFFGNTINNFKNAGTAFKAGNMGQAMKSTAFGIGRAGIGVAKGALGVGAATLAGAAALDNITNK